MRQIRQVYSNKGVESEYRKKMDRLVDAMTKSVLFWVLASIGVKTATQLAKELQKRMKEWKKIFGKNSNKMALWFVNSVKKHTQTGMRTAFDEQGYRIEPKIKKDIELAVYWENVNLINSIPDKYFTGIETIILMALMYGWTKKAIEEELKKRKDITERRVKVIASDQTHKANELFKVSICQNIGVSQARWVYTWRSEKPRESHIEMNNALFDLDKGCFDYRENEYVMPAQKINCKCSFAPIVKEFGDK